MQHIMKLAAASQSVWQRSQTPRFQSIAQYFSVAKKSATDDVGIDVISHMIMKM